jgi:kynureninase
VADPLSREHALERDAADPLAGFAARFVNVDRERIYLDGNSLGRLPIATRDRLRALTDEWGERLVSGWPEWIDAPARVGDALAAGVLGARPGEVVVGDSTTVNLFKLCSAVLDLAPGAIVTDRDNFPTDRYVAAGIAEELGLALRWIDVDTAAGVTPEQVAAAVGPDTALVVISHVAYRSAWLADLPEITRIAHDAGALVLADVCHSAGAVPVELDAWDVDVAVGCTYKYLNGGPGSPAFVYVAERLLDELAQPIRGWMGAAEPFLMGPDYAPAAGMRRFLSGTPPVIGMLAIQDMLALVGEVGIDAVRAKSVALTTYAVDLADDLLAEAGVGLASPRDPERRGGHVTLTHPLMQEVTAALWKRDVIPDYRDPHGLRLGLSPLSTSFSEVARGLEIVHEELERLAGPA